MQALLFYKGFHETKCHMLSFLNVSTVFPSLEGQIGAKLASCEIWAVTDLFAVILVEKANIGLGTQHADHMLSLDWTDNLSSLQTSGNETSS